MQPRLWSLTLGSFATDAGVVTTASLASASLLASNLRNRRRLAELA